MIFKDENDIKDFYPVSVSFKFENLKPIIENQAEPKLKELIGTTMYNTLLTWYADRDAMSAIQKELLRLCRNMVALHAFFEYIPMGVLSIQESGISVSETANWKPASQAKIKSLQQSAINSAFHAEEQILKYLEENTATFTMWASSEACTTYREMFVRSAAEFDKHHNIKGSRRLFRAMYATMSRIEREIISNVVGTEFYEELKEERKDDNLSTENAKLLTYIQCAVAKQTIADSLSELVISVTPNGVLQLETGVTDNMELEKTADKSSVAMYIRKCEEVAAGQLKKMVEFMDANVNDYPTYKDSTYYIDPTVTDETDDGVNDPDGPNVLL